MGKPNGAGGAAPRFGPELVAGTTRPRAGRLPDGDPQQARGLVGSRRSHHPYDGVRSPYPEVVMSAVKVEALQRKAMDAMRSGDADEALRQLERAIRLDAANPTLLYDLGRLQRQAGRIDDAIATYRRVLAIRPDLVEARISLGIALRKAGRHEEAFEALRIAADMRPTSYEAHLNLGNVCFDIGRPDEAAEAFRRALGLNGESAPAHNNLGRALFALGAAEQAAEHYGRAVELQPAYREAWVNLGEAEKHLGRKKEAAVCYQRAVAVDPNHWEAHRMLADQLIQIGQFEKAVSAYDEVLRLRPDWPEAVYMAGASRYQLKRYPEALEYFKRALELDPELPEAHDGMGTVYHELREVDRALEWYRSCIAIRPGYATVHANLAVSLVYQGRFQEGIAAAQRALELDPDFHEARFTLACVRLLLGDFERGWADYEIRRETADAKLNLPDWPQPVWRGEPLEGRTILLHAEQGVGDTIHFVRYVPLVAARGGRVIIGLQGGLDRLLSRLQGVASTLVPDAPMPPFDVQCPLMSLPHIFDTRLDTIPADIPYLVADPELVRKWRDVFPADDTLRVGIAWAGNPDHRNDRERSVDPALFAPLARIPGVRLYSLQKGAAAGRIERVGPGVVDLGARITDFADTAAVLEHLDLVLAVDTSVVHLAGAMGRPVWALLAFCPDWRWLLERDDSPWYPTARLFRQPALYDWDSVMTRVHEALEAAARSPSRARAAIDPRDAGVHPSASVHSGSTPVVPATSAVDDEILAARAAEARELCGQAVERVTARRYREAIELYSRALDLDPRLAEAADSIGVIHYTEGRFPDATEAFDRAIAIAPELAQAHANRALSLLREGRFGESLHAAERAYGLDGQRADARLTASFVRLLQGDFEWGLPLYEARRETQSGKLTYRAFAQPRWDGRDLSGETVLLHAEQGFGDSLQFLRYVPMVRARGARVVLEIQPGLLALARDSIDADEFVPLGRPLPRFDLQCSLASLPLAFGTTLATIPAPVAYLVADPARVEAARKFFTDTAALRVGVVWSGNPDQPWNRERAIPADRLRELGGIPGVRLYSLQKGPPAAEIGALGAECVDLGTHCADFADTAALVAHLDLVVTVDTAVAHLAGALGKPVWILLATVPDWRWLLDRPDSPWYPTARLFRQTSAADWSTVVGAVQAELTRIAPLDATRTRVAEWAAVHRDDKATIVMDASARPDAGATLLSDLQRAVEREPGSAEARAALADALMQHARFDQAVVHYRAALAARPDWAEVHQALGLALAQTGDHDGAEARWRAAIALKPGLFSAHNNLGRALFNRREFADAVEHLERAAAVRPDFYGTLLNLAPALNAVGRYRDGRAALERCYALAPDDPEVATGFGMACLAHGDFERGFAAFEARARLPEQLALRAQWQGPRWRGEPLDGLGILLHGEQGYGDTLQFVRFARDVARRGADVWLAVQAGLEALVEDPASGIRVIRPGDPPPDCRYLCALMDLPGVLGTTVDTVPAPIPYVRVPDDARARWAGRVRRAEALNVGLVWAGNPDHKGDADRSIDPARLAPLADIAGIAVHVLQKGRPDADEIADRYGWIPRFRDLDSFADTAAVVQSLDLVIGVDTAVIHLAGALGRPTWVLLAQSPDWRWLLEREDSPWYPTLRLFRQSVLGDWDPVIARVAAALAALAQGAAGREPVADSVALAASATVPAATGTASAAAATSAPGHAAAGSALADPSAPGPAAASSAISEAAATVSAAAPPVSSPRDDPTGSARGTAVSPPLPASAALSDAELAQQAFARSLDDLGAGRLAAAEIELRLALDLRPGFFQAANNLGHLLADRGEVEGALQAFGRALAADATQVPVWLNVAVVREQAGRFEDAREAYRRVLSLDADSAEAAFGLGVLDLLQGDFAAGWEGYERRADLGDARQAARTFLGTRWTGEALAGKRILLHAEQGYGDTVQFLRYVPLVAQRGASIVLEVQAGLEPVARSVACAATVISSGAEWVECDVHAALGSLPRLFGTHVGNIPAGVPYVAADPARIDAWAARFRGDDAVRVGLAWAGNPAHRGDRDRSIDPALLAPLGRVPGVRLYSLQKGEAARDFDRLGPGAVDLSADLGDFGDTAAALGHCDVVVSVDTSVAHLAGALARPLWLLLPASPDWRWLLDRVDSPWYPTARLFRQRTRGDWHSTVARMARALLQWRDSRPVK